MAFRQSRQILAGYPTISARAASEPVLITADFLVPAAGLGANDVIEMLGLEAGLVPAHIMGVVEDLDTGATLTLDCGVLSGPYGQLLNNDGSARTCGNEGFAASTVGQAGGVQVATKQQIYLLPPTLEITSIGFKVAAAPAGNVVGARIRLNVLAHAMPVGV